MKIFKHIRIYILLALLNVCIVKCLSAQEYETFEGEVAMIGFGTALGGDDIRKFREVLILGFELRANVSNNASMSVKTEFGITQAEDSYSGAYLSSFASIGLFGDYYLINKKNHRLFIGLGGGFMSPPEGGTSLGLYPRCGFKLGKFRISISYNQMPLLKNSPKYIGSTFGYTI